MEYPKHIYDVRYAEEYRFQTLDLCLPRKLDESDTHGMWIVFVHGGAWRDVKQDKEEIRPALKQLLENYRDDPATSPLRHVDGIASINYRLSGDKSDPSRRAVHPDHVHDVILALRWLEKEYGIGSRRPYMAVGHSCGATLAFQVAMDRQWKAPIPGEHRLQDPALGSNPSGGGLDEMKPPIAIVGLQGLYDLPLLLKTHSDQPFYLKMVEDALGADEEVWAKASPVAWNYSKTWPEARLVVIAQSPEDENVDWPQVDAMAKALKDQGWELANNVSAEEPRLNNRKGKRYVLVHYLTGKHDEVWEKGTQLCKTIELALRILLMEC